MDPPGQAAAELDHVADEITRRLYDQLSGVVRQALRDGSWTQLDDLSIDCHVSIGDSHWSGQQPVNAVASVRMEDIQRQSLPGPPREQHLPSINELGQLTPDSGADFAERPTRTFRPRPVVASPPQQRVEADLPPTKRRKATGGLHVRTGAGTESGRASGTSTPRRLESDNRVFPQRKKNGPENPVFQPSSLQKFINGVWESIFSNVKMDPTEVIEQWQAIESSGQPRLLSSAEHELVAREGTMAASNFGRMSILTRKISQTSRTCRSLEVIVQAKWVQLFDNRVDELTQSTTKEKAKKATIAEACLDFSWSEKELRNKMAIWRGYHDIQQAGGWAALVFAGMGLYRFCKYRVSFTEEAFQVFRALRHRFEVAADTLHPRWRQLLSIVGHSTERKYTGHPHDWVVAAPSNEALPLGTTYTQWDKDFSYTHLDSAAIDEAAWGLFDPRVICAADMPAAHTCGVCKERQSEDPTQNSCACFPSLYPPSLQHNAPVQVYRTPNGRNNGLIACLPIERGGAVGEFLGLVTTGLENLDVMVGQTERASYQIWQGRQGNHTRFVNHSCQPNSQYERFVWMGTQRIVLVSKGIEAGEEVTVDYSDTYWKVSLPFMQ